MFTTRLPRLPAVLIAFLAVACAPMQQTKDVANAPTVVAPAVAMAIYRDADPAAVGYHAAPGQKNRLRNAIEQTLKKDPQNVAALSQRGYWHANDAEPELAKRDFDTAMAASEGDIANRRHVHWSRGWARYGQGDIVGAIDDWHQAERLHGGRPLWVPYTYAVAYWTLGDTDRALAWYQAAVDSRPEWGNEASMKKRTTYWRKAEKTQLHALFAAWQANH